VSQPDLPAAPPAVSPPPFAESTPLGLLGLAVGCAALLPLAFGVAVTPAAFRTASMFCLLFGGGCQMIAGLMALANKNLLGGTMFTTFAFNWIMNWWALSSIAEGKIPDGSVILSVDVCFFCIFVVLTFAFGFFSKLLVVFLADIVFLYLFRILREVLHAQQMNMPIAICTVVLAAIALWLSFAVLVNSSAGRPIFAVPGPLFTPATPPPPGGGH
jgi:succinate-acetate transporter protein